jgi:hypothetical protein
MLICPAISDTDHVQPCRNNHGSQLSGNIMDEAMRVNFASRLTPRTTFRQLTARVCQP